MPAEKCPAGRPAPWRALALLSCALAAVCCGEARAEEAGRVPAADRAGFQWIRVTGGEFSMGAGDGEGDERPVHRARVRDFLIARTEVTQEQWLTVTGEAHPSDKQQCPTCAVTDVSWTDAQQFLSRAGELLGEPLRLPTEAEWEYAAGGGAEHQTWAGTSNFGRVADYAWFSQNSPRKANPVCGKLPNAFGICDMSGNVWEWCADWYEQAFYASSPVDDPRGPAAGEDRVLRGGGWNGLPAIIRVAQRLRSWPDARTPHYGFRPVKDVR